MLTATTYNPKDLTLTNNDRRATVRFGELTMWVDGEVVSRQDLTCEEAWEAARAAAWHFIEGRYTIVALRAWRAW